MVRESTIRSQWILFLDFARFPETEPLGTTGVFLQSDSFLTPNSVRALNVIITDDN